MYLSIYLTFIYFRSLFIYSRFLSSPLFKHLKTDTTFRLFSSLNHIPQFWIQLPIYRRLDRDDFYLFFLSQSSTSVLDTALCL